MEAEIKRLVTNECANHERKFNSLVNCCLTRRDGRCVFFFEDHPRCKYFEEAVLPLDQQLEALYHADRKARAQGYELTRQQKRIIAEKMPGREKRGQNANDAERNFRQPATGRSIARGAGSGLSGTANVSGFKTNGKVLPEDGDL